MKPSPQEEQSPKTEERKPYTKPAVERIQLLIEEAVLGTGCKSTAVNGYENPCIGGPQFCDIDGT